MTDPAQTHLLQLAAAWLAYGLLHSVLASLRVKHWVARVAPALFRGYRLFFNLASLITALPIVWLLLHADGPPLLTWSGPWRLLAYALMLAGSIGFLISLRAYDLGEFIGWRQWQTQNPYAPSILDQGEFRIAPCHRFVRHPWYCFSLLILWSQNLNAPMLVTAVAITLYLIIGSFLEEQKLIARYGATYRRYMTRVPGLLPLPGEYLSAAEAEELVRGQTPGNTRESA